MQCAKYLIDNGARLGKKNKLKEKVREAPSLLGRSAQRLARAPPAHAPRSSMADGAAAAVGR